ncbi:unnamed protein product [Cuscuta epithymum]|uniref:F-box protein At3g26010-like beta-propeller domain-containing protein n=1 Tax=Cuscuta epithymum TaxID=186058 RepID=A0AAV0F9H5_9ASTE|nr:unnamed protein product [Cuscuta epithymum]
MCEENKNQLSAKYIIVQIHCQVICEREKGTIQIATYSSETGAWIAAKRPVIASTAAIKEDVYSCLLRDPPLVMNGVFHWYHYSGNTGILTLALYRPDSEAVFDIRSYDGFGNNSLCSSAITRSENGDVLWFTVVDDFKTMRVFSFPKGSRGWVSEYSISVESLWGNDTALVTSSRMRSGGHIILNGLVPVNNKKTPAALIRREESGRLFLYDVDTKAVQSLPYHGRPVTTEWDGFNILSIGPECTAHYPYIHPSSLSAFAL